MNSFTYCDVQDFKFDSQLSALVPQFLASAHLWSALHEHRCMSMSQIPGVVQHIQEACKVLRSMLLTIPLQSPTTKSKSLNSKVTKKLKVDARTRVGATKLRTKRDDKANISMTPKTKRGMFVQTRTCGCFT